jgi:hypothetical protein
MSIRVENVHHVVPAKDWYAKFKIEGMPHRTSAIDHPVIAWVYAEWSEGDYANEQGWFGLGAWNDGPDFFETFADFDGYVHRDDL